MQKPFYLTTTLPYVNAEPHVGFAMELIRADAVARFQALLGREVFFNTGTDEHGQKLLTDATKAGRDVREYVDHYAGRFRELKDLLGISEEVHFIRTTDPHHERAAQHLWKLVDARGYIYKNNYEAKYCVGCELEKTDSELTSNGRCPIHPDKELEIISEENYFFAFSKTAPLLEKLYQEKPHLVIPDFRFNEAKAFLARGLKDFPISRLKEKMPWGVSVPGDEEHVMYVWFDALTNYISTLGWPDDQEGLYKKFWKDGEKVQYCGKDNLRQQSMMWQAMLLAAGLPTTDHIIIDGFINSGGQKMSKSLGNVLHPEEIIELFKPVAGELATDVLRYYLLRHINSFEDSDMTIESVKDAYQANLANGLGNLVSRVMTMAENNAVVYEPKAAQLPDENEYEDAIKKFDLMEAMGVVEARVRWTDAYIQAEEPFKKIKTDPEKATQNIQLCLHSVHKIAIMLTPFMPKTAARIMALIKENKKPDTPLFARL